MYEQDAVTAPTFIEPALTGSTPVVDADSGRQIIENPEFVILALHLRDAWNTAREERMSPGTWVFPRTVAEARDLTSGKVVESRRFRFRPDVREFRAAVRHLPG